MRRLFIITHRLALQTAVHLAMELKSASLLKNCTQEGQWDFLHLRQLSCFCVVTVRLEARKIQETLPFYEVVFLTLFKRNTRYPTFAQFFFMTFSNLKIQIPQVLKVHCRDVLHDVRLDLDGVSDKIQLFENRIY